MSKVLKGIYVLFKVAILGFICIQRFSNNAVSIFNYRLFGVVTGSMAPKYNIGDVLLCKEVDPKTLKVGDDISYLGTTGSMKNKVVTHRIIEISKDENGDLLFQTKGIATTNKDPVIHESQVYGIIVTEIGILSAIYKFIATPTGFYICIFVPLALLIGSEIIESMVERYKEKKGIKEEN